MNIDKKKTSYVRFIVKQRNIFGLALIENLERKASGWRMHKFRESKVREDM